MSRQPRRRQSRRLSAAGRRRGLPLRGQASHLERGIHKRDEGQEKAARRGAPGAGPQPGKRKGGQADAGPRRPAERTRPRVALRAAGFPRVRTLFLNRHFKEDVHVARARNKLPPPPILTGAQSRATALPHSRGDAGIKTHKQTTEMSSCHEDGKKLDPGPR